MEMNDDFQYMNDDIWPSEQGWWTMSLPMYGASLDPLKEPLLP